MLFGMNLKFRKICYTGLLLTVLCVLTACDQKEIPKENKSKVLLNTDSTEGEYKEKINVLDVNESRMELEYIAKNEKETNRSFVEIPIENEAFVKVVKHINSDIEKGFPGAVLLAAKDGKVIYYNAFGYSKKYEEDKLLKQFEVMEANTMFDLASLTKVYATTFAIMKLYDEGKITLDDPVYQYLPQFKKQEYKKITIRNLLSHTSGLPGEFQFYRKEGKFYSQDREKTIDLLDNVPLSYKVGETQKYSDIGFMVAGAVVEEVTGKRLDDYVSEMIYKPLGIDEWITYLPLEHEIDPHMIACTECMGNTRGGTVYFNGVRDYTLQGEVHDEKAYYSMEGVSGHAGLFGNAQAINTLNQVLLGNGTYKGISLFSPDTVEIFTTIYHSGQYQLSLANAQYSKTLSKVASKRSFYHTGWTGTFSLIDCEKNLSIVLLTNKRHSKIVNQEFEGALYDTGKYFSIIKEVYEAVSSLEENSALKGR